MTGYRAFSYAFVKTYPVLSKGFEIETDLNEAYRNILKLDDNEVFCDLGAYNGDTVEEFLSVVNGLFKCNVSPETKNGLGKVNGALQKIKALK